MMKEESCCLRDSILELINEEVALNTEEYVSNITSYASLLEAFVHLEFTEEDAISHWNNIIENSAVLKEKLGRKIGIHLAVVDYFTNVNRLMHSPMLIEVHVFRQTERLAMVDGLTGVFNRRYMDIVLKKEYTRCERYGKPLSVCMLDIDNFKMINDRRGHQFGDEVLRELSRLLKGAVREEDIVCRYGGEEFLLVLPETEASGALIFANRLRQRVKDDPFFVEHKVTFSAGTATFPSSALDIEGLVQAADRALYQAKFSGKDRVMEAIPERRKSGRYPHSWAVDIYPESVERPITGILTQNVSIGGIQFQCAARHGIDTPIRLVFTNIDQDIPDVEAEGRITWVKKVSGSYLYGVSFNDTPEIIEAKLLAPLQTVNELA